MQRVAFEASGGAPGERYSYRVAVSGDSMVAVLTVRAGELPLETQVQVPAASAEALRPVLAALHEIENALG